MGLDERAPRCGAVPTKLLTTKLEIEGQGEKAFYRGTHRLVEPEETLFRVQPFLPVMGITRIANVTGLDFIGIPVVTVCRPNSRSISVSQGKGVTLAAAKTSGLMEGIELYHAEKIMLPLKLASYEELRYTHVLVDVDQLPRCAGSPFHPFLQLLWIEGVDLLEDEYVWLPYEMVHTNFTPPLPSGSGCFRLSSSGLASGNHPLEALSHAICELVERDSVTLWSLRGQAHQDATRIDLHTVEDSDCRDILSRYESANVSVAVWDATSDVGISTFMCFIAQATPNPLRPMPYARGSGCHPMREIALLRALTEAAQSRLTYISGSRDDLCRSNYEHRRNLGVLLDQQSALEVKGPMRDFRTIATFSGPTFADDVAWELARLRAAGLERVIAVDLTKPEFDIPVVRVTIPGLESKHTVKGYTPGRRARAILNQRL